MSLVSTETMLRYLRIREQFETMLAQRYGCDVRVYGFREVSGENYILVENGIHPLDSLYHVFEVSIHRADRTELETVKLFLSKDAHEPQ